MAQSYEQRNLRSIRRTGKSLYERRIEAGEARGRTLQFARGHGYRLPGRPTEYGTRVARARAAGALTPPERAFVLRQATKSKTASVDYMLQRFREYGPPQRAVIMATQRRLARQYRARGRPQRLIPRRIPANVRAEEAIGGSGDGGGVSAVDFGDLDTEPEIDEEEFEELYPDFEDDWLDDDTPFIRYH